MVVTDVTLRESCWPVHLRPNLNFCIVISVNLMAALGSLSAIARQRPAFMAIVVQAFESLHGRDIIIQFDFNLTLKSGISYNKGNWFLQADKKKI